MVVIRFSFNNCRSFRWDLVISCEEFLWELNCNANIWEINGMNYFTDSKSFIHDGHARPKRLILLNHHDFLIFHNFLSVSLRLFRKRRIKKVNWIYLRQRYLPFTIRALSVDWGMKSKFKNGSVEKKKKDPVPRKVKKSKGISSGFDWFEFHSP